MSEIGCNSNEQKYQVLNVFVLQENFEDFTRCKQNWLTLEPARAKAMFEVTLKSAEQLHKKVPADLKSWETITDLMASGKAVRVYDTIFREVRDQKTCPLCGGYIEGEGAISRLDNHTMICCDCGQKEALNDMLGMICE